MRYGKVVDFLRGVAVGYEVKYGESNVDMKCKEEVPGFVSTNPCLLGFEKVWANPCSKKVCDP